MKKRWVPLVSIAFALFVAGVYFFPSENTGINELLKLVVWGNPGQNLDPDGLEIYGLILVLSGLIVLIFWFFKSGESSFSIENFQPDWITKAPFDSTPNLLAFLESTNIAKKRLYVEISSLRKNGWVNLGLGIFATGFTVYFLWTKVLQTNPSYEDSEYMFITRLSITIMLEFVALFFLNIYKRSQQEIKYFQNEITTLNQQFLAILGANQGLLQEGSSEPLLIQLAQSDRNRTVSPLSEKIPLDKLPSPKSTRTGVSIHLTKEDLVEILRMIHPDK